VERSGCCCCCTKDCCRKWDMLTNLSPSILLALACMPGAAGWAQAPAAGEAAGLVPGAGVLSGQEVTRSMLAAKAACRLPPCAARTLLSGKKARIQDGRRVSSSRCVNSNCRVVHQLAQERQHAI
jgi:hypothetical protein